MKRAILKNKVNFPLCLAPMVGLSNVSFRRLLREYLPANAVTLWPTEMLNSRKLPHEDLTKVAETKRDSNENCLVPQILGNEEIEIRESVKKLRDWGAEAIDINMGCPVKKALRHNYGVALMGDAKYAADVVRMTVKHSEIPVSVKLRAGIGEVDQNFLLDFFKGIEEAGASWISFHPRKAEQKRRGKADWQQIRLVRDELQIPVIGNGDIQVTDDVFRMMDETGCDMVMAGRALTARPWLLWSVGERLGFERPVGSVGSPPSGEEAEAQEYGRVVLKMGAYLSDDFGPELGYRKFKFFVMNGSCWLDFGHQLNRILSQEKCFADARPRIEDFFASSVRLRERTELRF